MLEQNISIDKLIEVLQRVKARDGIETVTTFELLHILPSDEAVEHTLAPDVAGVCRKVNHFYVEGVCANCDCVQPRHAGKA